MEKKRFALAWRLLCLLLGCITSVNVMAQPLSVSGVISDDKGEPMAGASIVLKGSTTGTIADVDGTYTIAVPNEQAELVFSFVGMSTEEVLVGTRRTLNVTLTAEDNALDEVVVIGYGAVKKRDLTGSVASVKSGDIVAVPSADPMKAIQGKVAGIDITPTSGEAGAPVEILIRGTRSINASNKPLFIIDGIQGGRYEDVNPADIASLEVLKDASATAIYGSQGANGVVIITTKKGVEGKTTVSYEGYYGINGLAKYPSTLSGDAWMQMRRDAYAANGITDDNVIFSSEEQEAIRNNQWVNWEDEVMETGTQQSHSVSVRSGSEKTQTFMSGSYYKEKGLFYNDDAERFTARLNIDKTVSSWVKAGMYAQFAYWDKDARKGWVLNNAVSTLPLGTPYDENGNVVLYPVAGQPQTLSPLADNIENSAVNNTKQANTSIKAYVDIAPVEWLSFRSSAGGTFNFQRIGIFNSANSISQRDTKRSETSIENSNEQFYTWDNVLNFKKQFGEHGLNITALTSYTRRVSDVSKMIAPDQQQSSYLFYNIGAADATQSTLYSNYVGTETMSYAGRVDYNLMGRYLLTASLRADGASPLAEGNKWAYFPSIAGAWRISDEAFMAGAQDKINDLKLRVSYGITGNAAVDAYATQSGVQPGDRMGFGDTYAATYKYKQLLGNKDLTWEKSATVDIGVDLTMFNSRLNLVADVYNTNTTDLLMKRILPSSAGGDGKTTFQMWQNVGATNNKGLEITINTVNIEQPGDGWHWSSALTFSGNKEKIVSMYEGDIPGDETTTLKEGYPVKSFFGYKKTGIWQLDEAAEAAKWSYENKPVQPGDIKIANMSDVDTVPYAIDRDHDWTYLGQAAPKWLLGFNNTVSYKGFDLNVYMFVRWGQMINYELAGRYDPTGANGQLANYNYWTPTNPSNDYPAANSSRPLINYVGYTSLNFIDGSYFKLKTLTLGYTFPSKWISKVKLERLRVYFTANNLWTVSKSDLLDDYDPERGGASSYPLSRQFVFGVNLDF